MTAWAHLPNAALIDEVLASARTNPKEWGAASGVTWSVARDAAWSAAWDAAWDTARNAARDAVWDAAQNAVWDAVRDMWNATWNAVWSVVAALIAYDDAGQFMKLPAEHLQRLYRIDPHPMFLLLQPAAIVFDPRTTP